MRFLFVMRNSGNARNFEALLQRLGERGHEVHLAFELTRRPTGLPARMCAQHPTITQGAAPQRRDRWWPLASAVRFAIDYLRYLRPPYGDTPALEARAAKSAPAAVRRLAGLPGVRTPRGLRVLDGLSRAIDRRIPTDPSIDAWMAEQRPDMVLLSPLVGGTHQTEYVRSAQGLGLRTALCVTSWDNLTNKGLIRDVPDHVYVWNEIQRREAIELHDVRPERVHAVGAHSYDHWFGWQPSRDAEAFRAVAGLPAGRPFLLYLCSSMFIARDEPAFVRRWIEQLRTDVRLREVGVLVRPHPSSGPALWEDAPLGDLDGVSVWPPVGADPNHDEARADYFDSIFHCTAVTGVNTSALIESAIIGRPVHTVRAPEFADTQQGTIHFRYLQRENGGPLTVAESFPEHLEHLAGTLDGDGGNADWNLPFVRSFVRPHGLDVAAAPLFADRLEQAGARPPPPARTPGHRGAAPALHALALAARLPGRKRLRRTRHRALKRGRALPATLLRRLRG